MGFIDFTAGEVLTAAQMDETFRQTVMRFSDAATRDTALTGVLAEGMIAYLDDTDEVLKYDGTSWIDISGDITGVTAGTALTGGGTSGNVTLDVDESALTIAQSQVTDLTTDLADKQDDVITTQGDIVIGDASGGAVRLPVGAADTVLTSDGTTLSFAPAGGGGFNSLVEITSSNATYTLPTLASPIVKFTLIGGGGSGSYGGSESGNDGGDTSVTYSATTVTASGGAGGIAGNTNIAGGRHPFVSANMGYDTGGTDNHPGSGGEVKFAYANLDGLSTINVAIGAGGNDQACCDSEGFNGIVIMEYVA